MSTKHNFQFLIEIEYAAIVKEFGDPNELKAIKEKEKIEQKAKIAELEKQVVFWESKYYPIGTIIEKESERYKAIIVNESYEDEDGISHDEYKPSYDAGAVYMWTNYATGFAKI